MLARARGAHVRIPAGLPVASFHGGEKVLLDKRKKPPPPPPPTAALLAKVHRCRRHSPRHAPPDGFWPQEVASCCAVTTSAGERNFRAGYLRYFLKLFNTEH